MNKPTPPTKQELQKAIVIIAEEIESTDSQESKEKLQQILDQLLEEHSNAS